MQMEALGQAIMDLQLVLQQFLLLRLIGILIVMVVVLIMEAEILILQMQI